MPPKVSMIWIGEQQFLDEWYKNAMHRDHKKKIWLQLLKAAKPSEILWNVENGEFELLVVAPAPDKSA